MILENLHPTKILILSIQSTLIEHFSFYLEFKLHLPRFDIAYTAAYKQ